MKNQKHTILDIFLAERPKTDIGVEGTDYINLDRSSTHEVGRMLAPITSVKFNTIFGTAGNMLSIMNYLTTPGFPKELLSRLSITKEESRRIPRKTIHVPNYWALVAYAMCQRVKTDKALKHLLQKQKINVFTAYTTKTGNLFGKVVKINERNNRLDKYVAIVAEIARMIKTGTFNDTAITQFIDDCKEHPEMDLYAGIEHTGISVSEVPEHHPDDSVAAELVTEENGDDGHFEHVTTSYDECEIPVTECEPQTDRYEEEPVMEITEAEDKPLMFGNTTEAVLEAQKED